MTQERKVRVTISREIVPDNDPDLSYLEQDYTADCPPEEAAKYREQDQERLNSYGSSWNMVGVRAKAKLEIPSGTCWILQTMHSPGLWGIEDDSDESYFSEVYEAEKATLLSMLNAIAGGYDIVVL